MHINCLELLAIFFAVQSFVHYIHGKVVTVKTDNTTAAAYLNHMGGCKSRELNQISKRLWTWCLEHDIWPVACHIPGTSNGDADFLSRSFNDNLEWKLKPQIFQSVQSHFRVTPTIDMFASRLNYQIKPFVSWHPDPEAKSHDAFSIQWKGYPSYCFPPFALINRVLRKIEAEQVTVMLVFPHWTMQTWYPRLLRLLTARPVLLPWADDLLYLPHRPGERHPLAGRLTLCAALLSGNPLA